MCMDIQLFHMGFGSYTDRELILNSSLTNLFGEILIRTKFH